jgi:urea carboxylase
VPARPRIPARSRPAPVLEQLDAARVDTEVVYRQSGDGWLLIEYGAPRIDLASRLRAHALMQRLERERIAGVIDLTPGIRSLQVHFDPARLPLERLLRLLIAMEHELPPVDTLEVPSRVVHLPLSWDDPATRLAIERYMKSVRPDAPWCPSNIEFIRRINGLDSIDDVQRIVFDAEYLVMALGDVYLGAPVATPVDPRHRLVTTKYNPARTWTPENAVGIGGAYLCVYGMEGPGGYQFVGRTVQMWNRWRTTPDFAAGTPWLLRFFDRIRFYPVTERELLALREDFPLGRWRVRTEEGSFRLADHRQFLDANAASIGAFEARRQAAFEAERERWRAAGQAEFVGEPDAVTGDAAEAVFELPAGARAVATSVAGNVWKLAVAEGDVVAVGAPLVIVESMKMEIPVTAPVAGRVSQLRCREGAAVAAGQTLVVLAP